MRVIVTNLESFPTPIAPMLSRFGHQPETSSVF